MIREKLYRDPVHDLISLDKNSREDRVLMELIDTPELQRLRRIRQLGMASMTYQGAEHSRFTHSLGVMWIATRLLQQLSKERALTTRQLFVTRCAALLHDIGHGPLSHVFESFVGLHHEQWTLRIVLGRESHVNQVLRSYDARLPGEVAKILQGKGQPAFLSQIISSQLDADRFDYLLRDSIMTGVKYGIYDLERILHMLRLDPQGQNMVVAFNGLQPVEKYLQSRYHMYSQVYLHKAVRAAEMMFGKLMLRASDLSHEGRLPGVEPNEPLAKLFHDTGKLSLGDYLEIDDASVYSCIKRWRYCEDPVLSDLASRLLERRLFKTLDVSHVPGFAAREKLAKKLIHSAGLDPRYYFAIDTSRNTPYHPYNPRQGGASNHILIEVPGRPGTYRDIYDLSQPIVGLTRAAFSIRRAVFPESAGGIDLRKQLRELFETTDTYLDLA